MDEPGDLRGALVFYYVFLTIREVLRAYLSWLYSTVRLNMLQCRANYIEQSMRVTTNFTRNGHFQLRLRRLSLLLSSVSPG
jgi:hypothetical protein